MVFASQNSSTDEGRHTVSDALRNRLHFMYMDSYSTDALIAIATHAKISQPEAFVQAFLQCKKDDKETTNMRTFYTCLREEVKLQNLSEKMPAHPYTPNRP